MRSPGPLFADIAEVLAQHHVAVGQPVGDPDDRQCTALTLIADCRRPAQQLGAGAYVKKPYVMERIGVAIRDELANK